MNINRYSWPTYFDNHGHLLDEYKLRKTSFFYGLEDDIRFAPCFIYLLLQSVCCVLFTNSALLTLQ